MSNNSVSYQMSTSTCSHVCSFQGCEKNFSRRDRLIIHLRTHTGERPYVCECGKSYARSSHLTRHKETAHTCVIVQPLKCEEDGCSQTFSSKQSLNKHIKRRHEQKLYKCTFDGCNRSFHKHQHLTVHEFEHTSIKPFKCTHKNCDKSFLLPSKLKQHMKVHTGYLCDQDGCNEKFETWTILRRHKYQKHPTIHTCSECEKTFTHKGALQQHIKSHSEEREVFACPRPNCGRTYLEQKNLTAHIKSYHDGQRFRCDHEGCNRSFSTKQKCQNHVLLHQRKDPITKRKSRKGIKKKSCAASVTGMGSTITKCDSVDKIQLSESESGIEEGSRQKDGFLNPLECQSYKLSLNSNSGNVPIVMDEETGSEMKLTTLNGHENLAEIDKSVRVQINIQENNSRQCAISTVETHLKDVTVDQNHVNSLKNLDESIETMEDAIPSQERVDESLINKHYCLCKNTAKNDDNSQFDLYQRSFS